MANWTEDAKLILASRYLSKDKKGELIESPDGMLKRVAKHIASAEKEGLREHWEQQFLSIMDTLEFLPNSPTLMNSGKENGQLAACFLLDIIDDLSNIFEQVKQCALIHKTGGGCFANGTTVITRKGLKNIKDCFKNEPVLCYNIERKKFEWGEITEVFKIDVSDKKKVEIEFEDGSIITCTEDHPFLVEENGVNKWVEAGKLTSAMDIVNYESVENKRRIQV